MFLLSRICVQVGRGDVGIFLIGPSDGSFRYGVVVGTISLSLAFERPA